MYHTKPTETSRRKRTRDQLKSEHGKW